MTLTARVFEAERQAFNEHITELASISPDELLSLIRLAKADDLLWMRLEKVTTMLHRQLAAVKRNG